MMKIFKLLDEMAKITLKDGTTFDSSEDAVIELKQKGLSNGEIAAKLNTTVASIASIIATANRKTPAHVDIQVNDNGEQQLAINDNDFQNLAKKAERELVKVVNKLGAAAIRKLGGTIIGNDENFLSAFNRKESIDELYLMASISVSRLGDWELQDDSDPYSDYTLDKKSKDVLNAICEDAASNVKGNQVIGKFLKEYKLDHKVGFDTHEKRVVELFIILRKHK